jgi:hypothetical protein
MSKLPVFLIIGAQRAGTTSLYADLNTHPDIFLPENKEPANLCYDDVLNSSGRHRYRQLFRPAQPSQICGEATTLYTMLPDHPGVPRRAKLVLGEELKLVYIVRHPIARARSHHHLELGTRTTSLSLDEAVQQEPRFLDYGRYSMQLEAWLEQFPPSQMFILRFEEYVRDRRGWLQRLCRFLNVEPGRLPHLDDRVHNSTALRPSPTPAFRKYVLRTQWYGTWVKPMLPRAVRRFAATLLLPKAPERPEEFSPEIEAHAATILGADAERFERLFAEFWPDLYRSDSAYRLTAMAALDTIPQLATTTA